MSAPGISLVLFELEMCLGLRWGDGVYFECFDSYREIDGNSDNWHKLQQIGNGTAFHVTLDDEVPAPLQNGTPEFVEIMMVPANFTARKTTRHSKLHDDDWVLHLDEEAQTMLLLFETDFIGVNKMRIL